MQQRVKRTNHDNHGSLSSLHRRWENSTEELLHTEELAENEVDLKDEDEDEDEDEENNSREETEAKIMMLLQTRARSALNNTTYQRLIKQMNLHTVSYINPMIDLFSTKQRFALTNLNDNSNAPFFSGDIFPPLYNIRETVLLGRDQWYFTVTGLPSAGKKTLMQKIAQHVIEMRGCMDLQDVPKKYYLFGNMTFACMDTGYNQSNFYPEGDYNISDGLIFVVDSSTRRMPSAPFSQHRRNTTSTSATCTSPPSSASTSSSSPRHSQFDRIDWNTFTIHDCMSVRSQIEYLLKVTNQRKNGQLVNALFPTNNSMTATSSSSSSSQSQAINSKNSKPSLLTIPTKAFSSTSSSLSSSSSSSSPLLLSPASTPSHVGPNASRYIMPSLQISTSTPFTPPPLIFSFDSSPRASDVYRSPLPSLSSLSLPTSSISALSSSSSSSSLPSSSSFSSSSSSSSFSFFSSSSSSLSSVSSSTLSSSQSSSFSSSSSSLSNSASSSSATLSPSAFSVPLLIFVTKQDKPWAIKAMDVALLLGLHAIDRPWRIQACNSFVRSSTSSTVATSFSSHFSSHLSAMITPGISEGLNWLFRCLSYQFQTPSQVNDDLEQKKREQQLVCTEEQCPPTSDSSSSSSSSSSASSSSSSVSSSPSSSSPSSSSSFSSSTSSISSSPLSPSSSSVSLSLSALSSSSSPSTFSTSSSSPNLYPLLSNRDILLQSDINFVKMRVKEHRQFRHWVRFALGITYVRAHLICNMNAAANYYSSKNSSSNNNCKESGAAASTQPILPYNELFESFECVCPLIQIFLETPESPMAVPNSYPICMSHVARRPSIVSSLVSSASPSSALPLSFSSPSSATPNTTSSSSLLLSKLMSSKSPSTSSPSPALLSSPPPSSLLRPRPSISRAVSLSATNTSVVAADVPRDRHICASVKSSYVSPLTLHLYLDLQRHSALNFYRFIRTKFFRAEITKYDGPVLLPRPEETPRSTPPSAMHSSPSDSEASPLMMTESFSSAATSTSTRSLFLPDASNNS